MLLSPEALLHTTASNDLPFVAALLIEAARKVRDGDRDAATAGIAHAVELLQRNPSFGSNNSRMAVREPLKNPQHLMHNRSREG